MYIDPLFSNAVERNLVVVFTEIFNDSLKQVLFNSCGSAHPDCEFRVGEDITLDIVRTASEEEVLYYRFKNCFMPGSTKTLLVIETNYKWFLGAV